LLSERCLSRTDGIADDAELKSLGEVSLNRRNVTLHLSLNQLFPADTESPSKGFRLRPKKLAARQAEIHAASLRALRLSFTR
jgi:hypothetical protein